MATRRSIGDRVTDSFRVLTQLDLSYAYERQAGTIALVVLGVLLAAAVLMGGRAVRNAGTARVEVELPSAGGLAGGDPVLVRGARVGRVQGVRLLSPGRVRATLVVGERYAPRADASASVAALDLVGSTALEYEPGRADALLPAGVPVAGTPAVSINERLIALRDQAAELAIRLREFDPAILEADVRRTRGALARAQAAAASFPADSLAAAIEMAAARGDSLIASLASLRAAVPTEALRAQRESLAASAAVLLASAGDVQGSLDRLREQVARGEGTVGRLQHDSAFRAELDSARTSLRLLLERFGGRRAAAQPQ